MKIKDIIAEQERHSTARDFGTPEAAVADEKADKQRKAGYHDGYTGKKPASRDPAYRENYKAGKETRAAHLKNPTRHTRKALRKKD